MSNTLTLNVKITNLGSLRDALRHARSDAEQEIAAFFKVELDRDVEMLKAVTPVKSGKMLAGWKVELDGFRQGSISNDTPEASFQLTGTRPHAIPGAFGYPLPFGTSPTFHPGTKQNQQLVQAMQTAAQNARAHFADVGGKVANTFARRVRDGGDEA